MHPGPGSFFRSQTQGAILTIARLSVFKRAKFWGGITSALETNTQRTQQPNQKKKKKSIYFKSI